jgi:iron complex transport system substrate-binding protein
VQRFTGQMNFIGAIILVLMLSLTACGSKGATDKHNEVSLSDTAAAEPATKVVSTIHGDIEIPSKPLRIVTDDYLGSLIALGVTPIGTPGLHLKNLYFADSLAGVEDIGDYGNSSIEKIISLQPDLIITSENDEKKYEMLSKAAPTISIPYGQLKNTYEELNYFGKLLGRETEAEKWLNTYDEKIKQAKAKVDQAIPADATFTIFEDNDSTVFVYGDNFGRGGQPIYQSLGRKPPSAIADEIMEKQWKELSLEVLEEYAGDYIILTSNTRTLDDFKKDPIWSRLKAVKNDHMYVWKEERSWYYDPIAVLWQTEELAAWLSGEK